jgi:hypothetical protein
VRAVVANAAGCAFIIGPTPASRGPSKSPARRTKRIDSLSGPLSRPKPGAAIVRLRYMHFLCYMYF